ncbi:MAG: hypothetical protein KDI51_06120 [Xanthomonadales bacterium]|nr:hypothetical protein [Xanthomonadales bacterium]
MPRRRQRQRGKPSGNWHYLLALVPIGLIAYSTWREEGVRIAELEREAVAQAQQRALDTQLFSGGHFQLIYGQCSEWWRERWSLHHQPEALAWWQGGLTAYFQQGADAGSWRQIQCDADRVHRGPRVDVPYADQLPAEHLDSGEANSDDAAAWGQALAQLGQRYLDHGLLGVELLRLPSGAVLRRDWVGLEGGATGSIQTYGDVDSADQRFPWLFPAAVFPLGESAPSELRVRPARRWTEEPMAALEAIAAVLPAGALISEIELTPDQIDVSIVHPTAAFDADQPPAPFGEMTLDEYGVASRGWWYPREEPGFGCRSGRTLEQLSQLLLTAQIPTQPQSAWYSCSPAFSDGQNGSWTVR